MLVTLSLTENDVFRVLGDFLTSILPNTVEVVRGQVNRVPSPVSGDYVVMIPSLRTQLANNVVTWDEINPSPDTMAYLEATQFTSQVDIHGPNSGNNAQIIATLFQSEVATSFFAASGVDIQPLFADDPKQIPFTDGEQQYETRWTIDLSMQINPVVTATQDFANQAIVGLVEIDATYPP